MLRYLRDNLWKGLKTSPFRAPPRVWILFSAFAAFAVVVGFGTGLLRYDPLPVPTALLLSFTLVVFPSLIEEAVFRGLLIPRNAADRGRAAAAIAFSTAVFVAWHPFNALVFTPSAAVFLNPWFLVIVTALGVTCGYAYVVSRSIWVPVIIHWTTVFAWVIFLGGRNLVLEM